MHELPQLTSQFLWAGPSKGHKVPRAEYESLLLLLYKAISYFNARALRWHLFNGCWWFTDKEMLLWLFPQELPSEQSSLKSCEIQLWCTTKSSSWVRDQKTRTLLMAPSNNEHCWIFQLKRSRCLGTTLTFLIISFKNISKAEEKKKQK